MVDTVHVQRNMERNYSKGVDDFYLASYKGKITLTGSLTIEEAVELMQKEILLKKAMVKLAWLPLSAPPDVASPMAKVFSQPDVLKRLASSYMKWLLKPHNLKMGEVSFCALFHNYISINYTSKYYTA
jgi:hypothetical protein